MGNTASSPLHEQASGSRPGKWLQLFGGFALGIDLLGGPAILVSLLGVWPWLVAIGFGAWALAFIPFRSWWSTGRGTICQDA